MTEKKQKSATQIANNPEKATWNLLNIKPIYALIRSKWYPRFLQWPTLLVFALIMYQLMAGPTKGHDNLGTALTWVLWWPLIPIIFLILGRFWCTLCPFGLINDLVQKFVGNRMPVPLFLKKYGIWIIDFIFIFITWSDHIWGIVESPVGSGILMLLITTGVVISGALWERRTWCRYLCFLGGLSGNYARAGMLQLRATPEVCKKCQTTSCYQGNDTTPGCAMFVFPRTMDTTAECNYCGDCVKTCPNQSIQLSPRLPTSELWHVERPKLEVAFLALVIMGIVFIQNITMLEIWPQILNWFEQGLNIRSYFIIFTLSFLVAMSIPLGLLLFSGYLSGKVNGDSALKNFTLFGYAVIPLDMAGHIAHNLFHLLAEGKAILFTALALFGVESHNQSAAIVNTETIQVLQYILIFLGTFGSIYVAYRLAKSHYGEQAHTLKILLPYIALIVLFSLINIVLFLMPMSMRM